MIILDLDNCISDDRWRRHLQKTNIELYHALAPSDNMVNFDIINSCDSEKILVITGRPESCRAATNTWFMRNRIVVTDMLMRPEGNDMPSPELKVFLLDKYLNEKNIPIKEIEIAFDDREDVLMAYIKYGVRVTMQLTADRKRPGKDNENEF